MSEQEDDILFDDTPQQLNAEYSEDDIQTLDWKEHIQRRPGMYIGKLGDGTNSDDGIYVLLKEVLDNSIDEYMMGFGKVIAVDVDAVSATVRDYGRGIPLGKLIDVSFKICGQNGSGSLFGIKFFLKPMRPTVKSRRGPDQCQRAVLLHSRADGHACSDGRAQAYHG